MTDLATRTNAEEAEEPSHGNAVVPSAAPDGPGTEVYAWAPIEPAPKKRRWPIWLGASAGVAVVGLVAGSLVLIAPGTAIAGVPVGE